MARPWYTPKAKARVGGGVQAYNRKRGGPRPERVYSSAPSIDSSSASISTPSSSSAASGVASARASSSCIKKHRQRRIRPTDPQTLLRNPYVQLVQLSLEVIFPDLFCATANGPG